MACIIFYKDPIYDIEGSSQINVELSPSVNWSSYLDDPGIWWPDDDMSIDWSHPSEDDLLQHTHVDTQPYLGDHPFEDSELFPDEDSRSSSCLNFDEHKDLVSPEESKTHTTKRQCFHHGAFHKSL
jgi:hypothetical protein